MSAKKRVVEEKPSNVETSVMNDDDNDDLMIVEFSTDISEAEPPPPLPIGEYDAEIRSVAKATSKDKGTRYALVNFFIPPEQFPADFDADVYPDGVTIAYRRVSLEDNGMAKWNLRRFGEAINVPMGTRIDMTTWIGQTARVSIEHEMYLGIPRAVITKVSAAV